jgi:hypothetical protein
MKTLLALAAACLSLSIATAASAKLEEKVCRAGPASTTARSCAGTPFANAWVHLRSVLCTFDYPESKANGDFAAASHKLGNYSSIEMLRKSLEELDRACAASKHR